MRSRYGTVSKAVKADAYGEAFQALPYNSGYFMCVRLKNADPEAFRKKLLAHYDTGVISVEPDLLRVAFSATSQSQS